MTRRVLTLAMTVIAVPLSFLTVPAVGFAEQFPDIEITPAAEQPNDEDWKILLDWLGVEETQDFYGDAFAIDKDGFNLNQSAQIDFYELKLDYKPGYLQYLVQYRDPELCDEKGCPIRILQPMFNFVTKDVGLVDILKPINASSVRLRDDLLANSYMKLEICSGEEGCSVWNYVEMFSEYQKLSISELLDEQSELADGTGQGVPQPPDERQQMLVWAVDALPLTNEERQQVDLSLSDFREVDLDEDPRTQDFIVRLGGPYFCGASLCEFYAFRFISDGKHDGRIELKLPGTSSIIARVLEWTGPAGYRTIELCAQSGCGTWDIHRRDIGEDFFYKLTRSGKQFDPQGPVLVELGYD